MHLLGNLHLQIELHHHIANCYKNFLQVEDEMDYIINNLFIVIVFSVAVIVVVFRIKKFFETPKDNQIKKVREWLLYAVTMAEKEYGSGLGKIKLRYTYDLFLVKFPWLARVITFEMFSELVDKALEEMRSMLEKNERVAELVNS